MTAIIDPSGVPEPGRVEVGTSVRTVRRSLAISLLAAVANVPTAILLVPVILSHLSLTTYGVYATISSVLAIATLAESGIATEIIKRVAAAHGRRDPAGVHRAVHEGVTVMLVVASALVLLGVLASQVLPDLVFRPGSLSPGLRHQVPWVIFAVVSLLALNLVVGGYFAVLRGLQRSDLVTIGDIGAALTNAGVIALCVTNGVGLWSFVYGFAAGLACSVAIEAAMVRRVDPGLRFRFVRISTSVGRRYVGVSTAVIVATLATIIDSQFDKLLLAHFTGPRATASYQIGSNLAAQARALALLPITLLLAGTAELRDDDTGKLGALERGLTRVNVAIVALVMGGIVVFAHPFTELWLGSGYGLAISAEQWLAIALAINLLSMPWYFSRLGIGDNRTPLVAATANLVVNAAASWALIVTIGYRGSLYGSLAGNAAGTAALWWLVLRRGSGPLIRPILPEVALGIVVIAPFFWYFHDRHIGWGAMLLGGFGFAVCLGASYLATRRMPVRVTREGGGPPRVVVRP